MAKLVIVESPHKAKTIQKFLGKDYHVVASVGHVRDLAVGNKDFSLGVDIANDFAPIYEVSPSKKKIVAMLKKNVASSEDVYLATDPDREGEAISWHLASELGLDVTTTKRLEFHEITYHAIQEAIEKPRYIDMNLVSSQETRRILDRIIGFKLSHLLQYKIGSKSAGRVQSVVLKLIVDRQKEIDEFKEQTLYKLVGVIKINNVEMPFILVDENKKELSFDNVEDVENIISTITNKKALVTSVTIENKNRASKPVYTTSTMQQEAASLLHFNSKKTMSLAQSLYEGIDLGNGEVGLITYMRTDSVRVNPSFINKTKAYIEEKYGKEYVGTAKIFNKSKDNVQDAHEGIRPTDLAITPEMVAEKASKDEAKLYRLIYNRAIASMMKDEIYETQEAILNCEGYTLLVSGSRTIFKGFTILNDAINRVPFSCSLNEGDIAKLNKLASKDYKTKGPAAYNEASLIHLMEKDGIGRPSTYASTLSLIRERDYVDVIKTYYHPTEQGKLTVSKLMECFASIINVEYTANMETKLDEIALGNCTKSEALTSFYQTFTDLYDKAKIEMEKQAPIVEAYGNCPKCGKPLVKRTSRYGHFLACSGYPNCKYVYNDNKQGQPCPKCKDGHLLLRSSRFGKFYACSNYPKCQYKESKELF